MRAIARLNDQRIDLAAQHEAARSGVEAGGRILDEITLDLMVLGVDALDPFAGATAHHEGEAAIDRALLERAGRVIAVADASKLGHRAFARISSARALSPLVSPVG